MSLAVAAMHRRERGSAPVHGRRAPGHVRDGRSCGSWPVRGVGESRSCRLRGAGPARCRTARRSNGGEEAARAPWGDAGPVSPTRTPPSGSPSTRATPSRPTTAPATYPSWRASDPACRSSRPMHGPRCWLRSGTPSGPRPGTRPGSGRSTRRCGNAGGRCSCCSGRSPACCAANLFLSQALSRMREFAIRAAAGASQVRLCRQLLTESLAVSTLAGLLGLDPRGLAGRSRPAGLGRRPRPLASGSGVESDPPRPRARPQPRTFRDRGWFSSWSRCGGARSALLRWADATSTRGPPATDPRRLPADRRVPAAFPRIDAHVGSDNGGLR